MVDSREESDLRRYDHLFKWLKSHGMQLDDEHFHVQRKRRPGAGNGLYTTTALPPSTPLFTLPSSAKINILTLSTHYSSISKKSITLTATQLISLHLFLHRPSSDGDCTDPLFGPYISVLPREFDGHPLTWVVQRKLGGSYHESRFLVFLPPAARNALSGVEKRFWDDWETVCRCMTMVPHLATMASRTLPARPHPSDSASTADYLWAWLNVNTRCLYDRIKESASDPDNISLCPIFDFANHTWTKPNMKPLPSDAEAWQTILGIHSDTGSDLTCITGNEQVQEGQELFLTYGMHPQREMLVEYGFVNQVADDAFRSGEFSGEADLQDEIQKLFEEKGEAGTRMKQILEEEGYWGDWTIHSSPSPAYPSYRLITALRLCHINGSNADCEEDSVTALQAWRDTTLGRRDIVSDENESGWRATLVTICETVAHRADVALDKLARKPQNDVQSEHEPEEWMMDNIRLLWVEEREVARAVVESLRRGDEF